MRGQNPHDMVVAMLWIGVVSCLILAVMAFLVSPKICFLSLALAIALVVVAVRLNGTPPQ